MEGKLLNDKPFLRGGPSLELCVIIKSGSRQQFLNHVLSKLPTFPFPSLVNADEARRRSSQFLEGWIYDEDTNTMFYEVVIPIVVNIAGWRKCQLRITELCHELYQLDFEFFGDRDDAPEWNQLGVKESDDPIFRECLGKVCSFFKADLGLMGFEMDAVSFFCLPFQDSRFLDAYERLLSAHVESSRDIVALGFRVDGFEAIDFKGKFLQK